MARVETSKWWIVTLTSASTHGEHEESITRNDNVNYIYCKCKWQCKCLCKLPKYTQKRDLFCWILKFFFHKKVTKNIQTGYPDRGQEEPLSTHCRHCGLFHNKPLISFSWTISRQTDAIGHKSPRIAPNFGWSGTVKPQGVQGADANPTSPLHPSPL